MKVIPPGLDFSNLKISPPPDPLGALNPQCSGEGAGASGWCAGAVCGAQGLGDGQVVH